MACIHFGNNTTPSHPPLNLVSSLKTKCVLCVRFLILKPPVFFVDSRTRCHVPETRRVTSYGVTVRTITRQQPPPRCVDSIRITGIVRVTQTRSPPHRVHASPESISVCPVVSYMGIIRGVGTITRAIRDE